MGDSSQQEQRIAHPSAYHRQNHCAYQHGEGTFPRCACCRARSSSGAALTLALGIPLCTQPDQALESGYSSPSNDHLGVTGTAQTVPETSRIIFCQRGQISGEISGNPFSLEGSDFPMEFPESCVKGKPLTSGSRPGDGAITSAWREGMQCQ